MAKNPKQTGKAAATAASKIITGNDPKREKKAAASALAQAPLRKKTK
ncbi:MAG: hypothetical protein WCO61_07165 [Alphaproteobacteria bacterium]